MGLFDISTDLDPFENLHGSVLGSCTCYGRVSVTSGFPGDLGTRGGGGTRCHVPGTSGPNIGAVAIGLNASNDPSPKTAICPAA